MQESGRTEQITSLEEEQEQGISTKDIWLIIMSLIVCVVGIANSMLMAVTERFQEIGTMKCLGALDRFVVRLFLLESGFQGLSGALHRRVNRDDRIHPAWAQKPRTGSLLLLPTASGKPRRGADEAWHHCAYLARMSAGDGSIGYRRGFPGMARRATSPGRSDAHRGIK